MKIDKTLKEWKQRAGLTSSEIAKLMNVSQPVVSRLEKNANKATIKSLKRYATVCKIKDPVINLND